MKKRFFWALGLALLMGADLGTVVPNEAFVTVRQAGGWLPLRKSYSLRNTGAEWVYWDAAAAKGQAVCEPAGGWIGPYGSVTVVLRPASAMDQAPSGIYPDSVTFHFENRVVGDIDGDGSVNVLDLIAFQGLFGGASPEADFDNSGTVDVIDMIELLKRFGQSLGGLVV